MLLYITTNKRDGYDVRWLSKVTYALFSCIFMGHHSVINLLILLFLLHLGKHCKSGVIFFFFFFFLFARNMHDTFLLIMEHFLGNVRELFISLVLSFWCQRKQSIELEIVFMFGFNWPNASLPFLCKAKCYIYATVEPDNLSVVKMERGGKRKLLK